MLPLGFTLLQVVPALDAGGVERTTIDVAKAVVSAGGRALVASAGGRMEGELAAGGGELIRMPLDNRQPLTLLSNSRRLARVLRDERVSIIHARSRAPAWAALRASRATRTPFVTTYAGVYNARSGLKRRYNSVMAKGDLVIANSEFTRDHLLAEHGIDPGRVIAIPRGIDLSVFTPQGVSEARIKAVCKRFDIDADDDRPVFLLAGRLSRWKGQALLIEALAQAELDAILVLAGDDQGRSAYREKLQRLTAESGLSDSVRLIGHVEDMAAAYLAADFACAPSLEPEAFGRTAVEPQAMGRPVLAAAHGAPCETVADGETGWLVTPGDVEAWAKALQRAASTSRERRESMGAAGRARVAERYSLAAMTDATLAAYARLLEARR